jgi:hypothetical protein
LNSPAYRRVRDDFFGGGKGNSLWQDLANYRFRSLNMDAHGFYCLLPTLHSGKGQQWYET